MDHAFTERMQRWLDSDHSSDGAVVDGARLLLALNGDKRYFERVGKNPAMFRTNVEYELKKFLRIRLANKTADDIRQMIADEMPVAEKILSEQFGSAPDRPGTPDSSSGAGDKTDRSDAGSDADDGGSTHTNPDKPRRGLRPDHESLPEEVKALWETNVERWKKIKEVYETLKSKADKPPCDRYDDCQMLADLDRHYRRDMQRYDEYVLPAEPSKKSPARKTPARVDDGSAATHNGAE